MELGQLTPAPSVLDVASLLKQFLRSVSKLFSVLWSRSRKEPKLFAGAGAGN
jgi:hypothetical protein